MCAPHVCLCCVTAFPRSCLPLSLFFSTCVPVLDGASAFPRSCLRLSPIVSPFVCLCLDGMTHCLPLSCQHMCLRWISEVLPPLVSHCLPTSAPVLDGVSAFPRSCLASSSFLCPFVGWYARFPVLSPLVSYVSHCLQLSVIVSRLPEVLSPLVSLLVSLCWMVRLPSPCCGLSPIVSLFVSLCWMVCLPEDLSPSSPSLSPSLPGCLSFLFPLVSAFQLVTLLVSVSWMVRASSRGLVSQLVSQLVFVLVSLCWVVCPSSPLSPTSPFCFPFVGWFVRLPKSLSRLSPSLCTSLSSFLFPFVRGCVHLPTVLSLLSPSLSSSLFPSLPPSLSLPCSPAKKSHAENCADLKVHRAPGLKMMCHLSLSSFDVFNTSNLTVLCCLLRALEPNTCTPIGCFLFGI